MVCSRCNYEKKKKEANWWYFWIPFNFPMVLYFHHSITLFISWPLIFRISVYWLFVHNIFIFPFPLIEVFFFLLWFIRSTSMYYYDTRNIAAASWTGKNNLKSVLNDNIVCFQPYSRLRNVYILNKKVRNLHILFFPLMYGRMYCLCRGRK